MCIKDICSLNVEQLSKTVIPELSALPLFYDTISDKLRLIAEWDL